MAEDPKGRMEELTLGSELFGEYSIQEQLPARELALLFVARRKSRDDLVLLKVLRDEYANHAEAVERFRREGELSLRLRAPHLVAGLDTGTLEDGRPFIVLDHVDAEPLSEYLSRAQPLPVNLAVRLALQAAAGLGYAHRSGVVHRDIAPRNLLIGGDPPTLYITNFDVARIALSALTEEDQALGTPTYMAPEQIRASREVDERADIWSLGVLLHELCAGHIPFDSENLTGLVLSVLNDPPDIAPSVPKELAQVIRRCLEKEPGRRFANMAQLQSALRAAAPGVESSSVLAVAPRGSGGSASAPRGADAQASVPPMPHWPGAPSEWPEPASAGAAAEAAPAYFVSSQNHKLGPGGARIPSAPPLPARAAAPGWTSGQATAPRQPAPTPPQPSLAAPNPAAPNHAAPNHAAPGSAAPGSAAPGLAPPAAPATADALRRARAMGGKTQQVVEVAPGFSRAAPPNAQPAAASPAPAPTPVPTPVESTVTLSLFEFAMLCGEMAVAPREHKPQVLDKYGLTQADHGELMRHYRERLSENPNEHAQWKEQYEIAVRHWRKLYPGQA